jgi:HD-GYP domain-containing protein (c-di-GMP phosphodiesterase class II)
VTSPALAIDAKRHLHPLTQSVICTQGHSRKVAAYAVLIAHVLGLEEEEIGKIRLGALLHDIGKPGIPEGILGKRGALAR